MNLKQDHTVHVQRRSCVCFDFNFLLASSVSRACFVACLRYVRAFNGRCALGRGGRPRRAGGPRGRWAAGGAARPRTMAVCGLNLNLKLTCLDLVELDLT